MGSVHAGFVEVLERTVTTLVPRVFASGNGFEPFLGIGIQTDEHGDFGGGHEVNIQMITVNCKSYSFAKQGQIGCELQLYCPPHPKDHPIAPIGKGLCCSIKISRALP